MEYELRRNRIRPGHFEEFLEAWLDGVVPLRRRFGFTFGGAWIVEGNSELVWILGYDGADGGPALSSVRRPRRTHRSTSPDRGRRRAGRGRPGRSRRGCGRAARGMPRSDQEVHAETDSLGDRCSDGQRNERVEHAVLRGGQDTVSAAG